MPKVVLSGFSDTNIVASGQYRARLEKIVPATGRGGVHKEILTFRITDEDSPHCGRLASMVGTFEPGRFWAYKETILVLGGDPDWFAGDEIDTDQTRVLLGTECIIDVHNYEKDDGSGLSYSVRRVHPI